jgi:hypothetical protein
MHSRSSVATNGSPPAIMLRTSFCNLSNGETLAL